jgi:hypothetical protein
VSKWIDDAREKYYGWELSHKTGLEAKTLFLGIESILQTVQKQGWRAQESSQMRQATAKFQWDRKATVADGDHYSNWKQTQTNGGG